MFYDDEKGLLRRKTPKRRTTPRDKQILPQKPKDPSDTKPFNVRPQKPKRLNPTDSLNTSRYAGPFRKPKNLTDSLSTASPVARKYRKLGSK